MLFKFAAPEVIKSVTQRALASYWDRLAGGRAFPAFTEFEPDATGHDPKQLVVWNIEGAGRLQKFRALYQGDNVAEVFNSNWAGKTMEQVVPMSLRRITLDAAKECAASGCLIYAIFSTVDANDQRIDCERLLLPFGRDGKVEQLLGSLQLKGSQGGVRRTKVLADFQLQAEVLFSGKIASGFTRRPGLIQRRTVNWMSRTVRPLSLWGQAALFANIGVSHGAIPRELPGSALTGKA
jgi:hypothetical protein